MADKILMHPSLRQAQDIIDICRPLHLFGITYFAHVHIDREQKFCAISNNPGFMEHYLTNGYYNADIHRGVHQFGNLVIWDAFERVGKSAKMHREAAAFGVQHTFTIIEKNVGGSDFYHFANNVNDPGINQTYLGHLDLLKLFILHFKEKVGQDKILSKAYQLKFDINPLSGYTIKSDAAFLRSYEKRIQFLHAISAHRNQHNQNQVIHGVSLTKCEMECLYFTMRGKTAKQIARVLGKSYRTVEEQITQLKKKLQVPCKADLIEKAFDFFAGSGGEMQGIG